MTPAAPIFLPDDTLAALLALLQGHLALSGRKVSVETIGEKDFGDDDQLILELPAVRVRYDSSVYEQRGNNARVYDAEHIFQIWCAAENLRSNEDQRNDTLKLLRQALPLLIGVKVALPDGSQTDPIRVLNISSLPDDNVGTIYITSVGIAGTAQFPGNGGA
jgi:hypothetical protein